MVGVLIIHKVCAFTCKGTNPYQRKSCSFLRYLETNAERMGKMYVSKAEVADCIYSLVALRVPNFASCNPQFLAVEGRDSRPFSTALLLQTERSAKHFPNPTGLSWVAAVAADQLGTPFETDR